jgi:drug/metabolite transporter (DMT)-like permease
MNILLVTSLIWAFSFGLIKQHLTGFDPAWVAAIRLGLASLVFLPFLRLKAAPPTKIAQLAAIGFIQFGLMYVAYLAAFRHLQGFQVALFTIFTPLWVTLISDALAHRFRPRFLGAALLAVLGTAMIVFRGTGDRALGLGFLLVQFSNICFALGQVLYVRVMKAAGPGADRSVFGWLYLGGLLATGLFCLGRGQAMPASFSQQQVLVLLYLGVLASAGGFFLWNLGAKQVSSGALAVMNNLKIPLGVLVSLLVFGEHADLLRLACGGALMGVALWVNDR